ncbi:enhanced serine sensitivity protein SseB [Anaerocolumna sp. AGMB13020]|uniref:enhanced serine sensitivity protein SseB n=1 Tax=Anaerocolumna sp. AGMB13020 TaxID=3081750 RepID=UPI002952F3EE|nr:enhanced serine sensitivity protein SseB [Anaerocolumna sp. AGMB13020]WOO38419.1 enhanced serine sensitivity protein SseB [Anaerocolumna sp. AGMB13020]
MQTIQQLIIQYSKEKSSEVYQTILERLKQQEFLWVARFLQTNNYYLDFVNSRPTAYIFTEKDFYDQYQDYMMQQMIQVTFLENKAADRMSLFGDLYRSGFETIIIDIGQQFLGLSLFDIIEKPDLSEIPEINRPVMNPTLVRTANDFIQKLIRKSASPELEEQLFHEIYQGKYLLAMDASKLRQEKTNEETGECVIKEDSVMSFPLITNADNKHFYAFFTDWTELRKFDMENKYSGSIMQFEDMKHFIQQADGIVINPFGVNLNLTSNMLDEIEAVVLDKKQPNKMEEQVVKEDTKVLLGEPKDYPQEMVNAISEYLKTCKNVKAVYLKLLIKEEEKSYLLVVDFTGEKEQLFSNIAKIALPFAGGMYIDFVPYADSFGKSAVKDSSPFYKKRLWPFR